MKETYTFSKHSFMVGEGDIDLKELEAKLVEYCLSRGYIITEVKTKVVKANASYMGYPVMSDTILEEPKDYAVAECYSAYAGKKIAREIYKKNGQVKPPTTISAYYKTS